MLLVPTGRAATSDSERLLRRRIADRRDLEARGLSQLAALAAQDDEDGSDRRIADAERRLEQADEAFSRFDYQGATTQLGEALELLRPTAVSESGRRRLAAVHLTLAMVLLVHGEREAALEEVRTCLHLDARCAPDSARHPPELAALHEEVRAGAGSASGELRVTTDPPRARARLDGQRARPTPASWSELSPGRHYLTLERDGYLPEVHVINVAPSAATERRFALTLGPPEQRASAALRALERSGVDAEPRWRAQAATLAAADVLLVLSLAEGALALGAFDARGQPSPDRCGPGATTPARRSSGWSRRSPARACPGSVSGGSGRRSRSDCRWPSARSSSSSCERPRALGGRDGPR
ncbi:MAG: PEGA domain-containing protein [Sandaracinaceae bacterium]|nr:PEGA domain-containing protein [Sandaracinaceae bacterium]